MYCQLLEEERRGLLIQNAEQKEMMQMQMEAQSQLLMQVPRTSTLIVRYFSVSINIRPKSTFQE